MLIISSSVTRNYRKAHTTRSIRQGRIGKKDLCAPAHLSSEIVCTHPGKRQHWKHSGNCWSLLLYPLRICPLDVFLLNIFFFFFYRIYWFPNLVSIYLISKLCSHFYILPTSTELKVTVNSTTIATYSQKGRVSVCTATCKRNTVTTEVTNFQFILPTPFINPNTGFVITVHSS